MASEIETPRLLLRSWRDEDLDASARLCADRQVMRYLPSTLTREQSEQQIARFVRHWEERGFGLWAVEIRETGAFAGFMGLQHSEDWPEGEHKTEVGWRLDRAYWGRRFTTEGALASLHYGFDELGLERIISITLPENTASRRVMEKSGLSLRGEARWRGFDMVWYDVGRKEWRAHRSRLPGRLS